MTASPRAQPLTDAHHHLWDPRTRDYPWMRVPGREPLRRPYGLDDLRDVTGSAGVGRTILVQTVSQADETPQFLAAAGASGGLVGGVVGWVDLCAPDVADRLARLREGEDGGLLVGVRHQVEDEPDLDWLGRPAVRRGIAAVVAAGLVYDLLVRFDQLPSATALADALPDARLVLDHGAKPPVGQPQWSRWAELVAELARREHVTCKLSGLFTEVPAGRPLDDVAPSAEHLLACFGPRRLMVGSDWPVSTLATSYADVMSRTLRLLDGLSDADRLEVRCGTAARTYGVAPA